MAFTPIKQHVKRGTGSRNQFTGPARTCSTTWRDVYMQTMHVRRTLPRMHAWTHTSMDRTFPPQTPRQTWSMNADRVDGMGWSRLQAILPTAKVQQRLATCKRCIDPLSTCYYYWWGKDGMNRHIHRAVLARGSVVQSQPSRCNHFV
jgi:hypothetical protein